MKKVYGRNFLGILWSITLIFSALASVNSWADPYGTGLGPNEDEMFPPSRFGMAPLRVQTGVQKGVASRETASADANERTHGESDTSPAVVDDSLGGGGTYGGAAFQRKPAGLELGGSQSAEKPQVAPPARNLTSSDRYVDKYADNSTPVPTSGSDPRFETRGVQEVALIASDLGFFPKTIFVSRDVPVRLFVTGASKNTLCIMIDSLQVRKQVRSQKIEEIPFTPSTPGKYRFYCPVNGMEGTMVVKEFSSDIGNGVAHGSNTVTHISSSDMLGN